jgi:poly-gamma-glutamate synthesis protein (capsule biosynthesis protein)
MGTLLAVGDILSTRGPASAMFGSVADTLSGADVLLGNQEGPVTDQGELQWGSGGIRGALDTMTAYSELGFSAVTLANNHIMEFGPAGLFQTIELLDAHDIRHTGAGASIDAAHQPAILDVSGTRMAMLNYSCVFPSSGYAADIDTPGVATIVVDTAYRTPPNVPYQPGTPAITVTIPDGGDTHRMIEDIRSAKAASNIVIAQFHWGVAFYPRCIGYMKELGRAAIDAGADIVLGHHPHILLGCELYNGKPICYSLGHFAFDPFQFEPFLGQPGVHDSVIFKMEIVGDQVRAPALLPVAIDQKTRHPELAQGRRFGEIRHSLDQLSESFGTTFEPHGNELRMASSADARPPILRAPDVYSEISTKAWRGGYRAVVSQFD